MRQRGIHFTTRDLLMMAALAALGGVVRTCVCAQAAAEVQVK